MPGLVTFSSDYGVTDEFVGVCHLIIARIAPGARVIDVAHGIRGIRAGSAVLAQSLIESSDDAVHLAVVDPGVGTDRRAAAIACGNGSFLVGPDNGLFFPVADLLGGVLAAYELKDPWFMRAEMSQTFHGRDIFAPAAAHLALGTSPHEFGPPIDPAKLVRLPPPTIEVGPGKLVADVLRSDHFGNLQLAATAVDLVESGLHGPVTIGSVPATVGEKFADVESGGLVVYVNSAGHLAVACNAGSASVLLGDPAQVAIAQSVTGLLRRGAGNTLWMRRRPVVFALAAALALLVNAACHFDVAISIVDFGYVPPNQTVELHTDVEWTNNGAVDHTVTSKRSGGFFDSGPIPPSNSFTHTFAWAGTFPYHCEIHPEMTGRIATELIASPPVGTRQDDYTITWALGGGSGPGEIPDGFNMDVQINPPGRQKGWTGWRMNQTDFETMDDFSPSRRGEWKFRARLQRKNRWASGWSPVAVIDVN